MSIQYRFLSKKNIQQFFYMELFHQLTPEFFNGNMAFLTSGIRSRRANILSAATNPLLKFGVNESAFPIDQDPAMIHCKIL